MNGRGVVSDGRGLFVGDTGTTIIDNFEESPDGPYSSGGPLSDFYDGDTGDYHRDTSAVVEGSFALYSEDTSGAWRNIISQPGSGLPTYPGPGDWIGFLGRPLSGDNHSMFIVCGGTDGTGYAVRWNTSDFGFRKWTDRRTTITLGSDNSLGLNGETWYWFEMLFPDSSGQLEADVYQLNTSPLSRGSQIDSISHNVVNSGDDEYLSQEGVGMGEDGNQAGNIIDWARVL